MHKRTVTLILATLLILLVIAGCQKGGAGKKDKARTDDLEKSLEAQRKEAERQARERAAEARMCVAESANEFQKCTDQKDNDCDKQTDCNDTEDCAADPGCANQQTGGPGVTAVEVGE